ncbi:MAG: DUF523 domain-containing protein [Deltaproteobacteria bacterium]|nr:DUF523 domain-containing protein [Deltaproteobacteria bacterium]
MQPRTSNRLILVSSCLLGLKTRYDATDNYSQAVADFLTRQKLTPIPVCPEQLGGLPTPRPKCWFNHGDGKTTLENKGSLCDEHGNNPTMAFIHGAEETLKIARMTNCRMAILQQRSPSCGSESIYLNAALTKGMGVTTALLKENGLEIFGDDNLPVENR